MNMADFRAFVDASNKVDELYLNRKEWITKAILNVARIGKFSSDRAIKEYANDIWKIQPLPLELSNGNNARSL